MDPGRWSYVFLKDNPRVWTKDSNLRMFIVNPSLDHHTANCSATIFETLFDKVVKKVAVIHRGEVQ